VTFDATLHKGHDDVRGDVTLRDESRSRFTLGLHARTEKDTLRLELAGEGGLAPLSPWLPAALTQAARTAPVDVRAQLGLSPGDRAAGRASVRLGDLVALEGNLSFQDKLLRFSDVRAATDLALAGPTAGLPSGVTGRAEVADGEITWAPERGGWPQGRATVHLLDAVFPPASGVDARAGGVELKLVLEPREGGASVRGDLRGDRVAVAGLEISPIATPLRIDLDGRGAPSRVELTAVTAQVLGTPLRGAVAYDVARARADGRVEASAARLDALLRRLGADWLGPSDQVRAGSIRMVVTALDPRGLTDGKVEADLRDLALHQPEGEAAVERASLRATVASGRAAIVFDARRVHGTLRSFEGQLARLDGTADVARDGGSARLDRATVVARDGEGREMLQAELAPQGAGAAGPVRLTARLPALERLAPLWPSIQRQVTGSATVELTAPDAGFGAYEGRLALQVATAELLGGRLSLRDVSGDVPLRRGGATPPAGADMYGPFKVGEFVGYGVVLYDVTARARAVDQRLTLTDLRYGLYSGEGSGTIDLELGANGPTARARITGERVRIDEFMAAYGVHGGTMTGLLRYDLNVRYGGGRFGADGQLSVPQGGTVTIELLDRLLSWAQADPTGVVKTALGNLRNFDYKAADMAVRTQADDIRVTLSLKGREILGIFPPRVKEINVVEMPMGFLAKQFPGL
jgi:hypothetical protein